MGTHPRVLGERELSNKYQYDRVKMFFFKLCVLVFWTKVASALEGYRRDGQSLVVVMQQPVIN